MPTTSQLVTWIEEDASGWNRDGPRGILPVLNEVHRYLMSQDTEQNVRIVTTISAGPGDTQNGRPPFFQTQDTVVEYDLPADCRRAFAIGIDAYIVNNTEFFYNFYNQNRAYPFSIGEFIFRGHPYYKIPIQTIDNRPGDVAKITFVYNPGTTTDKFHIFYWALPREITSEPIQLQVPEQYHDTLLEGCLAFIQWRQYNDIARWKEWKRTEARKYWKEMDRGAQGRQNYVRPRGF